MKQLLNGFRINVRNILALVALIGAYWILYSLVHETVPEKNRETYVFASGVILQATVGRVMRHYFPEKEERK